MKIKYFDLGPDKRVCDIVFAGSHDASITSGKSNAQTQSLNIDEQAKAGVRIFDLRILARGGSDGISLVGYHGSGGGKSTAKNMKSSHTGKTGTFEAHSKMSTGTFGLKLSAMLSNGKKFVDNSNEFLIFKFDKCTNYQAIAECCVAILGTSIYKPIDKEFGKLTLSDLKGKVVCVFSESGLKEIPNRDLIGLGEQHGILGFRNLRDSNNSSTPKAYMAGYKGLQYFGKGGTNAKKIYQTQTMKMEDNKSKQKKIMHVMATKSDMHSSDVLGMMYWTSTGALSSIESRNKVMWAPSGVSRMEELWSQGLEESIGHQLEQDKIKVRKYGGARRIKAFFPNIIMIDFADPGKCQTIYDLNSTVDAKLAKAYDDYTS